MTDGRLVFNGVNGATGKYGLEPKTVHELAAHILGETAGGEDDRRALEESLDRNGAVDTVAALVRLLAENSQEEAVRDEAWRSQWIQSVAERLAQELLGDEFAGNAVKLKALESRLSRDSTGTLEKVARLLVENKPKELASLLLVHPDEAPDNADERMAKLRRFAADQMTAILNGALRARRSAELTGSTSAQREWLEDLITSLQLLPVAALAAGRGPRVTFVSPLKAELDKLAGFYPAAGAWLGELRQTLAGQPGLAWHELLQNLQNSLAGRIEDPNEGMTWTDLLNALRNWLTAVRQPLVVRGVIEGVDPTKLAEAGWGIIFPVVDGALPLPAAEIRTALKPLLDLRRSQADQYYKEYVVRHDSDDGFERAGFRPSDTARDFLRRQKARPADPADPKKVPYYLLIVGGPEAIPFHFQYQLDVQYAVGRLDFGADLEAYASYARSVVACEEQIRLAPRAAFFGAANPADQMTALSAEHLVTPLHDKLKERYGDRWGFEKILGEDAKRERLSQLIGGEETPALLFTACHGMEYPKDDAQRRQVAYQGALLCQDWLGPEAGLTAVPRSDFLAGEDVTQEVNLLGLIAFFFACYSAGTPRYDEYTKQAFKETGETITETPFIAALPKAMLSLRKGGALAVVGHVERAWGTSFLGDRQDQQIAVFESAVERLLKGHPVGSAMEYFNGRYAALSTELTVALDEASFGRRPDDYELAELWTANNDARGYIIIGDPAVRLPIAESDAAVTGRQDLDE